ALLVFHSIVIVVQPGFYWIAFVLDVVDGFAFWYAQYAFVGGYPNISDIIFNPIKVALALNAVLKFKLYKIFSCKVKYTGIGHQPNPALFVDVYIEDQYTGVVISYVIGRILSGLVFLGYSNSYITQ